MMASEIIASPKLSFLHLRVKMANNILALLHKIAPILRTPERDFPGVPGLQCETPLVWW